jgi:quinol-cytochrome oxidoreductase complex cytochrome b subunit
MSAAVSPTVAAAPQLPLRRWLGLDAVVTGVNGLAYLALAGPLSDLLDVDRGLLLVLGAVLVVYALDVGWLARKAVPSPRLVSLVIDVNAAWAVASIVVLVTGVLDPSTAGYVWIPLQAAVVMAFAVVQYGALRAVRASS